MMDIQPEIVGRFGDEAVTERLARAAAAARAAGVLVIYVKVGFREGHPEVSSRNQTFSRLQELGGFVDSTIHEAVVPQAGDVVVTKRSPSGSPRSPDLGVHGVLAALKHCSCQAVNNPGCSTCMMGCGMWCARKVPIFI
jgi:nicotinamidase-related amidase